MNYLVDNPIVSVRILVYNHEKYIAQCLDGIMMQKTNFPFEVIIGEDCSTDGSREICRQYQSKYPNIINLIENEKNLGAYENGQKTIAQYRGKYIAWCDGDDYWTDPYKLQKQVDVLENNPNIAICFHKVEIIDEINKGKKIISNPNQKQISTIYDLALVNFIHSPSVMFRYNLFGEYPDFMKTIPAADYAVHMLNASKGNVYFIEQVMACYREHPNSVWANKPLKERHKNWFKTQNSLLGLFNCQVDDIIMQSRALFYLDLYHHAKQQGNRTEQKEALLSAMNAIVDKCYMKESDALLNVLLAEYKPLLDRDTDYEALFILGKLALKRNMFDDSVLFLNDVLKINPDFDEALYLLAQSHKGLGNIDKATEAISAYLRGNPNHIPSIILFSDILLMKSNSDDKVINILERLLSKGISEFQIFKNLGKAYFNISNYPKAAEYLSKAIDIIPHDVDSLLMLSNIKTKKSLPETAAIPDEPITLVASEAKPINNLQVSVVIVVQNNLPKLRDCISVLQSTKSNVKIEIIVVDNASSDGTDVYLKEQASKNFNFRFMRNSNPMSFSKACNIGIRSCDGDYIFILDCNLIATDYFLDSLVELAEIKPKLAIATPLICSSDEKKIVYSGYNIGEQGGSVNATLLNNGVSIEQENLHANAYQVAAVPNKSMLIRTIALSEIGVFDEQAAQGEDILFCMNARRKGYEIYCIPDSRMLYGKSDSIKQAEPQPEIVEEENSDNIVNSLKLRLDNLLFTLELFKEQGKMERFNKVLTILTATEPEKINFNKISTDDISEDSLTLAEMILSETEDEPFDIEDIFGTDRPIAPIEESPAKKLKILMTMYGWNESGGGTTFPKSVAKRLASNGIDVTVFYATANHPSNNKPYFMEEKIEDGVRLCGVYNRPTVFLDTDNPEREIKDDNILALFEKVLDEVQPDIVHFNNFLGLSFAMAELSKRKSYLNIYTPYNYHLIDPTLYLYRSDLSLWSNTNIFENSELIARNPHLKNAYENRVNAALSLLNEHLDYTFAVSSRVKEILCDFGADSEKISIIHQVHETIEPLLKHHIVKRKPERPIKFGFIGGVMPHKGAHIIVQAAQLIPKDSAEFYIHGFVNENYQKLLKSLDRNNVVKIMGEYKSEDFKDITDNLDAMILPSLWEDCAPFVITESIAMKLPVICSRIGGFPDFIIDNHNGRLYNHNSSAELATILNSIINNPSQLSVWQENCKINITFEQHIEHLISVYKRLAAGERPKADDIELIF